MLPQENLKFSALRIFLHSESTSRHSDTLTALHQKGIILYKKSFLCLNPLHPKFILEINPLTPECFV